MRSCLKSGCEELSSELLVWAEEGQRHVREPGEAGGALHGHPGGSQSAVVNDGDDDGSQQVGPEAASRCPSAFCAQFLTLPCPPGVSLRSRAKGRLPIPMVILPFMKHGDLHAFLLASRIGENPLVSASGGGGREAMGGRVMPGKGTEEPGREEAWWAGLRAPSGEKGSEPDNV